MALRFSFDAQFLDDVEEIYPLIAARSRERAEGWQAGLFEQIETLLQFPNRCPVAREGRTAEVPIRELLFRHGKNKRFVYRVLFRLDGDTINILSVRHSSQDFRPI